MDSRADINKLRDVRNYPISLKKKGATSYYLTRDVILSTKIHIEVLKDDETKADILTNRHYRKLLGHLRNSSPLALVHCIFLWPYYTG